MRASPLTAESEAVILLCARLGSRRQVQVDPAPLSSSEWSSLTAKFSESTGVQPRELLGRSADDLSASLMVDREFACRLAALLNRGGQLAFELDRLAALGIWALTCADDAYPATLRNRLGNRAPPVLFGAGSATALSTGGVAIVGSRDLTPAGETFAAELGEWCAEERMAVISGGARGTDRLAMLASVEAGGRAVGILADGLERSIRDPVLGRYIRRRHLTLATPFHPAAGFDVGNAMARNKLIYGLADHAVVVASSEQKGGTWAGAVENLRAGWVPLHVMSYPEAPSGNGALIRLGGRALSPQLLQMRETSLIELLSRPVAEVGTGVHLTELRTDTSSNGDMPIAALGRPRRDKRKAVAAGQGRLL